MDNQSGDSPDIGGTFSSIGQAKEWGWALFDTEEARLARKPSLLTARSELTSQPKSNGLPWAICFLIFHLAFGSFIHWLVINDSSCVPFPSTFLFFVVVVTAVDLPWQSREVCAPETTNPTEEGIRAVDGGEGRVGGSINRGSWRALGEPLCFCPAPLCFSCLGRQVH